MIVDPPRAVRVKYGLPEGPLHLVSAWAIGKYGLIGVWLATHPAHVPGQRYPVSDGRTREEVMGWEARHIDTCTCSDCRHARAAEADKHETYISAIEGRE